MATGVEVRVGGKVVKGVSGYSVDEESTPVDVSDTTGATGRMTVRFFSNFANAVKRMRRKTLDLEDLGQGTTQGIARLPSFASGVVAMTADSRSTLLAVDRTAQPYNGTLGAYFAYLLGLVGITSGYVVHSSLNAIPVTFPGWQGDVWLHMKRMLPTVGAEVSLVSDNIVLRPLRGRITVDKRDIDYSWTVDDTNLALAIEGYYYNNEYHTNYLAYPSGGWNEDVQVYQVDAGEVIEFDVPISASLSSIDQPIAQDNVTREEESASVYCVMGNDGLPITAAQWNAGGGSIDVEIGEDTRSLVITITGASIPELAPFRIAATAGPSDNYSSLRIIGDGVFFDKVLVRVPTTISEDIASNEIGTTIDNEFISTLGELMDAMIWPLARYGGARQSISVKTKGINREGDSGSYAYPTIADFNAAEILLGHADIADFNTYAGVQGWSTIADFNAYQFSTVADDFVNQAFGNVAGARTRRENNWWRIRKATIGPDQINYTAEVDTTLGDFNAEWGYDTPPINLNPSFELGTGDYTVNAVTLTQDTAWATDGAFSGRLVPNGATTDSWIAVNGDLGAMRLGMIAGETYTVTADIRLTGAQIGALSGSARTIRFFRRVAGVYTSINSVAAPNAAGVTSITFTFTVPIGATEAFIRLYNGASVGNGDVWWDNIRFVKGVAEAIPTIADFNDEMTTLEIETLRDFNVAPLERVAS